MHDRLNICLFRYCEQYD